MQDSDQNHTSGQLNPHKGQPPVHNDQKHSVSENKEHEPLGASSISESESSQSERPELTPSHQPEVPIPSELRGSMEQSPNPDTPNISKEVSLAGVAHSKESTPLITTPSGNISLPMSYEEARQGAKQTKTSDSLHWLTSIVMYQWAKYSPDKLVEQN